MIYATSNYPHRLQWLKCVYTKNNSNGQEVEEYHANGYLWGRVEEIAGRREQDYGADRPGAQATITIRDLPSLAAVDRLSYRGRVWRLDQVRQEDNQLVADAFCLDQEVS